MNRLGELSKCDIRKVWLNEAYDFTPWLAHEENIARLGKAVGLELSVENTEVAVGPYSADILARDTVTGDYVVIENQLERTNHDHLGKALTYGAALDASAIIWIATSFTDEHRKALDWLNDNTSGDIVFYGVQIELWQIDDSKPAIQFNVVSRPVGAVGKAAVAKASEGLGETKKLQLEFWTAYSDALSKTGKLPSVQSPRPQYWYDVALGRTGFHLSNTVNTLENKIGVRVYLGARFGGEEALRQLMADRESIEREIGEPLQWNPNEGAQDKVIVLLRDVDLDRKEKWPEYIEWMVDRTLKFRDVFRPRIRDLELERTSVVDSRT